VEDIVTSGSQIVVTLIGHSVMKRSRKIVLDMNRYGQLPTVLINPRSTDGRIVPGIWLGDPHDFASDGTTYRWLTAVDDRAPLTGADVDGDETADPRN
jgi:hypothetical protein